MSRVPAAPEKEMLEEIDDFLKQDFGGSKIGDMFSEDKIKGLKLAMVGRVVVRKNIKTVCNDILQNLRDLGEYHSDLRNVKNQIFDIKNFELKPGNNATPSEIAANLNNKISVNGPGYHTGRGNISAVLSSVWGGSEEAKRKVRKNKEREVFTVAPPSTHRNLVMDARGKCREDIEIAETNLFAELNGGAKLTEKQEKKIRGSNYHLTEASGYAGLKAFNWLTRGIFSHSKAGEDSRFIEYQKNKEDFIARTRMILDPTSQGKGAGYLNALRAIYEEMARETGVLSTEEFGAMQQLISNALVAEVKFAEGEVKDFNNKIKELNDEMLKSIKDVVEKEDDMWKYRIAQIILIISPLGVFNYMIPIANILGPLLSANLTFGEGVGEMMAKIPILGTVVSGIKLDVAMAAIIDNTPILSELGGVVDAVTDNDAAQELFGTLSPLVAGSPLIPIAIALGISARNAEKSFENTREADVVVKKEGEKLEAVFKKLEESVNGDLYKARVAEFAAKEINANANRIFLRQLVAFIAEAEDEELGIFKDVKFNGQSLSDLKKSKQNFNDPTSIMKLLLAPDVTQEMRDQLIKAFFVYDKIREEADKERDPSKSDAENITQDLDEFNDIKPDKMTTLANGEYARRRQEFVIELAESAGMPKSIYQGDTPESRKMMAAEYEMRMIQDKVNRRDTVMAFKPPAPNTSPTNPQAKPVSLEGVVTEPILA